MPSDKLIRGFRDILDNIARIERFTAGLDAQALSADERIAFAVLHALLIISEAARRLGADAETHAPDQPWRAIRSLGNVLRHEYEGVDLDVIWRIVFDDLPVLKQAVTAVLADLRSGKTGWMRRTKQAGEARHEDQQGRGVSGRVGAARQTGAT